MRSIFNKPGQQQTEAYFAELGGARELRITNTRTDRVFMTAAERASERLTYRDAQAILNNCPSVLTVDPEITRYRGRIVKTTGDGMLAEFASADIKAQRRRIVSAEIVARSAEAEIKLARILVRHRLPLSLLDVQELAEFLEQIGLLFLYFAIF